MGLTIDSAPASGPPGVAEAPEAAVPDRLGDEADEADEDAEAISPEAAAADTEAQALDLFAPDRRELTDPGPAIALADPQQPSVTSQSEIHPATVVEPAPAVVEPLRPWSSPLRPWSSPLRGPGVSMRCLTAGRPVSAEAPEAAVPDHPDGAADEDAGMASPADVAGEGLPAAQAVAAADSEAGRCQIR